MTSIWVFFPAVLVLVSFLSSVTTADVSVSCEVGDVCVLPCSFPVGDEEVIHWLKEEKPDQAKVFSYYYDREQLALQSPQFKGRTLLFLDQVRRGNASLRLSAVRVQDGGRFKCYTSTVKGNDETFISLSVHSPVRRLDVRRTEAGFTCSAQGVYPEPELSWSTKPPSGLNSTALQQDQQQLYSISSNLTLLNSSLNVSCTVSTPNSHRRVTVMTPKSITVNSSAETIVSCTSSPAHRTSLLWRFNHNQIILNQTGDADPEVTDGWRTNVDVSNIENLKLQQLTSSNEGTYTCEASSTWETLSSDTHLTIEEPEPEPVLSPGAIVGIVIAVLGAAILAAFYACLFCRWRANGVL